MADRSREDTRGVRPSPPPPAGPGGAGDSRGHGVTGGPGKPGGKSPRSFRRFAFSALSLFSLAAVLVTWVFMAFNLAGLVIALGVVPGAISSSSIYATLGLVEVGGPAGVAYFLFLAAMISLSVAVLAQEDGRAFLGSLSSIARDRRLPAPGGGNGFFVMAELFLAVYFVNIAWTVILSVFGLGITVPASISEARLWEQMFFFAEASVVEELMNRVLLIGVPLYVAHGFSGERGGRGFGSYLWGGRFAWTPTVALLVFFSSVVFGFLHLGWDWTKIPPVIVAGLAFGYAYVRKGLGVAVLLHFAFDYMGILASYLGEPGWFDLTFLVLVGLILVSGPFITFVYSKKMVTFLRVKSRETDLADWRKASVVACGAMVFAAGFAGLAVGASGLGQGAAGDGPVTRDVASGHWNLAPGEWEMVTFTDPGPDGGSLGIETGEFEGGSSLGLLVFSPDDYAGFAAAGGSGTDAGLNHSSDALWSGEAFADDSVTVDGGDLVRGGGGDGDELILVLFNGGGSGLDAWVEVRVEHPSAADDDGGTTISTASPAFALAAGVCGTFMFVIGLVVMAAGGMMLAVRRGRGPRPGSGGWDG